MKKKICSICFIVFCGLVVLSCSDDENNASTGPMTIEFDNRVGTADLELNTDGVPYSNAKGEAFSVTSLTYYISNIKLKRSDGTIYTDLVKSDGSAGYYLIDEADGDSQEVTLENILEGEYTEVTFTVGVDASQVDEGAQTGPLDPANGLFWSWNSGYIFMAMEGKSPVSTEPGNVFQYHVGGYKDDTASPNLVNNIKIVTLSFNGDSAPVRAQHEPEVHLLFDVEKFLNGPGTEVTFASNASRHSPRACQDLAGNISNAFIVDHIHAN